MDKIDNIKQRIEAGLIGSTGGKIQDLFVQTAKKVFNQGQVKKDRNKQNLKNKNVNRKKWFDKECNNLKIEVRKLGRHKGKDPKNNLIREKYHEKLRLYKRTCMSRKHKFWLQKFDMLEDSLNDPKGVWSKWKNCTEQVTSLPGTEITGDVWFNHFSKLHTAEPGDTTNPNIDSQLPPPCEVLNSPFTITELLEEISKMKNNKSVGYDSISNEMIKGAPRNVLEMILDFINLCVEKSLAAESLCKEIITPIFKSGSAEDPNNYRGICVSSSLTKLLTSLINTRLQKKVDENKLISKNQIGFKKHCRTADHLLTLKTIVKKYVTKGGNKLYTCFVDLKKAFDSICHTSLFNQLRKLGLNGKLLSLVEDIYKKTKCTVKVNNKITDFFKYTKGVRQGCPLSPLLFNLYINDIFHVINQASDSSILLSDNDPINALMYADDLIVIAKSGEELQEKMDILNSFFKEKKLSINETKTKCMVFNRGNKLCKNTLRINGITIENVKTFRYLGFTVGAKNCSFNGTCEDLGTKTKRAIFALNSKIKLSRIPIKLALKIFATQLAPILLYTERKYGDHMYFLI